VENLIKDLAERIRQKMQVKEFHCMIADGTGFGDSDTYKLRWKRGKPTIEVSAHIKVEVLIGVVRDKKVVLEVKTDRAYLCERRLLREILRDIPFRAFYFLGDAYYGMESGLPK
ncbi:MAG: IS5-like element ISAae1 family transposase, partial [Caldimicrobium sp.]